MKQALMEAHRALVKTDMVAARMILQLLIRGTLILGLGDSDWQVQTLLESLNVPIMYHRTGNWAMAKIKKG